MIRPLQATSCDLASPPALCPARRASLMAPSIASVPLFEKKAAIKSRKLQRRSASCP